MSFNSVKLAALQMLFGVGAPSQINDAEYAYYSGVVDGSIPTGVTKVDFFIDKTGTEILETDNSPSTVIAFDTRISLPISGITTPEGDTLDNYTNIEATVELFTNSKWGESGFVNSSGGIGVSGGLEDNANVVIQSGSLTNVVTISSSSSGGLTGQVGTVVTAFVRVRVKGLK